MLSVRERLESHTSFVKKSESKDPKTYTPPAQRMTMAASERLSWPEVATLLQPLDSIRFRCNNEPRIVVRGCQVAVLTSKELPKDILG